MMSRFESQTSWVSVWALLFPGYSLAILCLLSIYSAYDLEHSAWALVQEIVLR